ncbi:flavin-containing monooxygenase [Actinomycetospora corticicola]|uniref:Acetone monooxygenase n=1 Tax=Actinomycetospora corticicola TaxID=663602 RepID=A0A7Y9DX98_9PSEU|nr:NAD(P)/FAD-dependent oxidoreductase [Actinomycetospora corticicola]NYD37096.1 acetone monooxygenase [Actinomycetospora corticicola]
MDLDVAVVGAGFSGLLALHLLREAGLRAHAFDAAGNVGGTWWWHAYPGSHLDTSCEHYQYRVSEQLYRDWGWSERYPAGYEVQRWFRFVADRLDLRRSLSLRTRVVSAVPDDGVWALETAPGGPVRARELVVCPGRRPVEPAVDTAAFAGLVVRTAAWPEDGHDLTGRRVGIVGTTPATVQLVPWIVDRVASLVVLADGAVDVVRRHNPVYGWQERADYRAHFPPPGEPGPTPADRAAMRARTEDRRLLPDAGSGPVVLDDGYLEAFARDHVTLASLADLVRVDPSGFATTDGTHELDVLVVADAFDAGPPALDGIADGPGRHVVVARPDRTPCVDLQDQVEAVVGTILASTVR